MSEVSSSVEFDAFDIRQYTGYGGVTGCFHDVYAASVDRRTALDAPP